MKDASPEMMSIFCAALERLSAQERAAYLEAACGRDVELRARLEALLQAHDQAGGFLPEKAEVPETHATVAHPSREGPATVIGPYKLLQQLGEGGMGTVFLAEQTQPVQRKVALKIIKPGMDSRQVIARFEAERQALALMDHPNIAKVFDAGTTETGRPYFVMELVKGVPITRYCDEHRLTPKQRLALFVPVCQAVQHAHQKGIIHRDLKPSNVLVAVYDDKPVPKVIDFGIAKATGQQLTERTLFTDIGQVVGTLEYMSPEQAGLNQLDIDTRSDIYSLGVLLYELLTGTTPLERKRLRAAALLEMLRLIREEEPPKPSTRLSATDELPSVAANRGQEPKKLSGLVRGELDWMVMKSLEKDRNRRYETANGFAQDIQRYLADEPVQACPPSATYRMRRFLRRNKGRVLAAALVLLALIGGIIGTTVGLFQAQASKEQAQDEARKAVQERLRADDEKNNANAALLEAKDQKNKAVNERKRADEEKNKALREKDRAEQNLVTATLLRVGSIVENNPDGARLLLDDLQLFPVPLRDAAWAFYHNRCRHKVCTLQGHSRTVCSLAWSKDGKVLASGAGATAGKPGGEIKLWDVATGKERASLKGHTNDVRSVAFSPDGNTLASATYNDRTIQLWDVATGKERATLEGHAERVCCVAFSGDGKMLASASFDKTIKLWDVATGGERATLRGHTNVVEAVAWSPDGKTLASSCFGEKMVRLWDAGTGQQRATLPGHVSWVSHVFWSGDGKTLASTSGSEVKLWDVATGRDRVTFYARHLGALEAVAFSSDDKFLATANLDGTVQLWESATGAARATFHGQVNALWSVVWSPDGSKLACGGGGGTIQVWNLDTGQERATLRGHRLHVKGVSWSVDGATLASASGDRTIRLWDVATGQERATLQGHSDFVSRVVWSPDGKLLASASFDKTIKLWDVTTGLMRATLQGHSAIVTSVSWSPDGKTLASASADSTVKLWDVATRGERATLRGQTRQVQAVAWSPDGKTLASASTDKTIKLWDVATGGERATLRGHTNVVHAVAWSPDGKTLASASWDKTIKLWDPAAGQALATLSGHDDNVYSLAWSPDGKTLASASQDKTIKLWDAVTGHERATLHGHAHSVSAVAWSPDGKTLASAGADKTIKLWDVAIKP